MGKNIISGVILTEFDDFLGPNPIVFLPEELDEEIRRLVSLKTITLLSGEEAYIPQSLVIIPFASLGLKGIVKYMEWPNRNLRGGRLLSAITLLFKEANDLIFYKYLKHLQVFFDEIFEIIRKSKELNEDKSLLFQEFKDFHDRVIILLEELKTTELQSEKELIAFPEPEVQVQLRKEYIFKIIVCGDAEVGKTSTILNFTDRAFKRTYIPTIGVNITEKSLYFDKHLIQFTIWDIAGQEKFGSMRRHFYNGVEGLLIIFDLTREATYKSVKGWYEDVKRSADPNIPLFSFLLGNKNDLTNDRIISQEQATNLARDIGVDYFETSALTGENIEQVFYKLAELLVNSRTIS